MDSRVSEEHGRAAAGVETKQIDIRGQICPSSLLATLKEINDRQGELTRGAMKLAILTDNRDATATIPAAAEKMGYKVSVTREGSHYAIRIEK